MPVRLDLNNKVFQSQWFSLEEEDRNAVLQSCIKLGALEWEELYRDRGSRWEWIHSRRALDGSKLYSLRTTKKMRAVARRSGEFLELLTLHPIPPADERVSLGRQPASSSRPRPSRHNSHFGQHAPHRVE